MKLTRRNIYITTGGTLVLGSLIWILVSRHNKKKKIKIIHDILDGFKSDPTGTGNAVMNQEDYKNLPVGNFPLKIGDKNKKVYEVQKLLNQKFGTSVDLDGKYGEQLWEAMCNKIWNTSFYTTQVVSCYEYDFGKAKRRDITASDYEKIRNFKATTY